MKARLTLVIFTLAFLVQPLNASLKWGKTGHRTIGAIADQYLTGKTKRNLKKILNHESLAFTSTFADEIKSDDRYNEFYSWHFVNMASDETYENSTKNPEGDLITGIERCKEVITDENASMEDKAFYLKMLIHLIGDLHQPLHVGRSEDRGGNDIKVQWQFRDTNLHTVWDSKMIDAYDMSYSELAQNADYLTKDQVKAIQQGSIIDWAHESQQLAKSVYASAKEGDNLRYKYSYEHFETVRSQLQKGGIRLAKVLNDLF
ncbi:S1/P1 nuclease [Mangrovimonas sp. DI 80]|uniref:S1/P1 nuclease n=1 Tax=Mangrovimonas sp. DI 80 TaxID=1779330 RepID=UPI00097761B9|nr:S1/P1 nuclease [Mangrovimonas sp. DI 80]OMP29743.1 S1/P1 Nuclease [Mangrovimonas sp. DI 80]